MKRKKNIFPPAGPYVICSRVKRLGGIEKVSGEMVEWTGNCWVVVTVILALVEHFLIPHRFAIKLHMAHQFIYEEMLVNYISL